MLEAGTSHRTRLWRVGDRHRFLAGEKLNARLPSASAVRSANQSHVRAARPSGQDAERRPAITQANTWFRARGRAHARGGDRHVGDDLYRAPGRVVEAAPVSERGAARPPRRRMERQPPPRRGPARDSRPQGEQPHARCDRRGLRRQRESQHQRRAGTGVRGQRERRRVPHAGRRSPGAGPAWSTTRPTSLPTAASARW